MWFAALKAPQTPVWLNQFLQKLQQGSAEVLALLTTNPCPDQPHAYIRTYLFSHSYTTRATRAANGQVWQRHDLGVYPVNSKVDIAIEIN